jgi:hypothetical protein
LAVRVRLRVRSKRNGRSVDLIVLAKGGAESARPCIVVDEDIARNLGLWPSGDFKVHGVEEAPSISEAYVMEGSVELELLGGTRRALVKRRSGFSGPKGPNGAADN